MLAGDLETLAEAQANPLIRRYPEKTMAYSEVDALIPYVPGVYPSARKPGGFSLRRTQSNTYFSRYKSSHNPEIRPRPRTAKKTLFCFLGRKDCRVRTNLIDHDFRRDDVLVRETTGFMHWQDGIVGRKEAQREYAEALARTHFALCPRGMGFGSIRFFEVMEMGVAPVLLADQYALPPGPSWGDFLLQVPEADFRRLPEILETHVAESAVRGEKAREAWERYFSPEVAFDRMVEQLEQIRMERVIPEWLYRKLWPLLHVRPGLREWVRNYRKATD